MGKPSTLLLFYNTPRIDSTRPIRPWFLGGCVRYRHVLKIVLSNGSDRVDVCVAALSSCAAEPVPPAGGNIHTEAVNPRMARPVRAFLTMNGRRARAIDRPCRLPAS